MKNPGVTFIQKPQKRTCRSPNINKSLGRKNAALGHAGKLIRWAGVFSALSIAWNPPSSPPKTVRAFRAIVFLGFFFWLEYSDSEVILLNRGFYSVIKGNSGKNRRVIFSNYRKWIGIHLRNYFLPKKFKKVHRRRQRRRTCSYKICTC